VLACDGFSGFLKVYRVYHWSCWISEGKGGPGLSLAVVRDLREARVPAGPDELAAFETDVLAGFVLARAAAGLSDNTIRSDVLHLEQLRAWFGGPLWNMEPADADAYFGRVLRDAAKGTRLARSQALKTYFLFLEIRHKVQIHQMTGRVAECPVDEMNRPRGAGRAALRIPPSAVQVGALFAGWRADLATCRKFAPAARSYAAARLMADAGLRVNEVSHLDLADVKWDLGRFGKLHVRIGKGARGSGPRERMVPLINGAGGTLRWFIQDVW
jgi:integrase/recombinase XerD